MLQVGETERLSWREFEPSQGSENMLRFTVSETAQERPPAYSGFSHSVESQLDFIATLAFP